LQSPWVVSLGGNAFARPGGDLTMAGQFEFAARTLAPLAATLSPDRQLLVTHGNGPQVGNLLLQQESCDAVPKMPLEIIGAMTQGQIGYMLESSLDTALMEIGIEDQQQFVTIITYVVVDENDPGFENPTKPIGPFYSEEEAKKLSYNLVQTDKGYRRVVASPKPLTIVEHREIKKLIDLDFIVICCGGGGIPVIRKERKFRGVEAVIDKDLASSILAREIKADIFLIVSDIEGAAIRWGTKEQKVLGKVSLKEMQQYIKEGHFPAGSMGPKVDAIVQFFEATGNRGVIAKLDDIELAIAGKAGTEIIN